MSYKTRNWTLELMSPKLRKELLYIDINKLKIAYEKVVEFLEAYYDPFYDSSIEHPSVEDLYFKSKIILADILSKDAFNDIMRDTFLRSYSDAPLEIFSKVKKSLERSMTENDEKDMVKEWFLEQTFRCLEAALEERDREYIIQWEKDQKDHNKKVIEHFLYNYRENRKRRGLLP